MRSRGISDECMRRMPFASGSQRGCASSARVWCVVVAALGPLSAPAPAVERAARPNPSVVVGLTVPSRVVTLAAVIPARIARLPAAEGGTVCEGDEVVSLEDAVQRARTELARASADSTLEIEKARVRRDHAAREWDRLAGLRGADNASSKESSDAKATAELRRLECDLALFEQAQAVRNHRKEKELLEQYHLRAPFDGYVVEHIKRVGETVDRLEGIIKLAQLDPLVVVVDCPLSLARRIDVGDRVRVTPTDAYGKARFATIILNSRVADGASQTVKVKLTVPNDDGGWVSGLKVAIDFADRDSDTLPAVMKRGKTVGVLTKSPSVGPTRKTVAP